PARLSAAKERANAETIPARLSAAKERANTEPSPPPASEANERASARPIESPDRVDAPTSSPPETPAPAPRLIMNSTMPPPPPNVVTVRRMSGPPIPREEPEPPNAETSVSRPGPDDAVSLRAIPEGLDARALFDILGWETGSEEPDRPPPSSALALPPHRPPHAHVAPPDTLPSIIVDVEHELATIVDRIVDGDADESAEGELLRQGERAMRVIMARFPGPLTFERGRIATMPNPPRASECGPLLRLVARERRVALPFVIERLSDPDPEVRGWATHLLCELLYDDAVPHIVDRLRDPDACTRASAAQAVVAAARVFPDQVRDALRSLSKAGRAERAVAIGAMARLRHAALVPDLIAALSDSEGEVVGAAHDALTQVTAQDFGHDARPWLSWWTANASRHRIEWLIDALTNDVSEIRRVAGEELRVMTREYFGYSSDLPPRDRERTQQRYRDWWVTEGRTRFRRR
ncbi:MAG: HEAT repeat domain-containing protein, partial [Myxococcota bacterium]|nr:HEAT repeat domain-containing protein [Myxococcota bacterium]